MLLIHSKEHTYWPELQVREDIKNIYYDLRKIYGVVSHLSSTYSNSNFVTVVPAKNLERDMSVNYILDGKMENYLPKLSANRID